MRNYKIDNYVLEGLTDVVREELTPRALEWFFDNREYVAELLEGVQAKIENIIEEIEDESDRNISRHTYSRFEHQLNKYEMGREDA